MFTKWDKKFDDMAADPTLRAAAIAASSKQRNTMFWIACLVSLMAILINIGSQAFSFMIFIAAMQWIQFSQIDSNLKLLRVIDRLQRDGKTLA